MNTTPVPQHPFGESLLDKSTAHPGSVDMSIFQSRSSAPLGQGTVSNDYLERTRREDPWPDATKSVSPRVTLLKCWFLTAVDQLATDKDFELQVDVRWASDEPPRTSLVTVELWTKSVGPDGEQTREEAGPPVELRMKSSERSQLVKGTARLWSPLKSRPGDQVTYWLEASHPEADTKAKSDPVDLVVTDPESEPDLTTISVQPPVLHLGFFFDGTGNDKDKDWQDLKATNIAKLWALYPDDVEDQVANAKHYLEGLGTSGGLDTIVGQGFAVGFAERIERSLRLLTQDLATYALHEIVIDVFGFSRGASLARHFVNQLYDAKIQAATGLALHKWKLRFVGLFDTVGSVGVPGNDIDIGVDLSVWRSRIPRLVHLISHLEVRSDFPLQSIRQPPLGQDDETARAVPLDDMFLLTTICPPLLQGWEEIVMPGVHADVGGGYSNDEYQPLLPAPEPRENESVTDYVYRYADLQNQWGAPAHPILGWRARFTREDVERRVEAVYQSRREAFETARREHEAGNRRMTLEETVREYPGRPSVGQQENTLARIPLWVMVDKAAKEGVKWKAISKLEQQIRAQTEPINSEHPLFPLFQARHDFGKVQMMLNPWNPFFRETLLRYIHDSRWQLDTLRRGRVVYFKGKAR